MEITIEMVMAVVTGVATFLFGLVSKRFNWIETKYIPIQNILVGIVSGLLCFILGLTNDMASSIVFCLVGAMSAGGTYDIKNVKKE